MSNSARAPYFSGNTVGQGAAAVTEIGVTVRGPAGKDEVAGNSGSYLL